MMKESCLTRLMQGASSGDGGELRIQQPTSGSAVFALYRRADGELVEQCVSNSAAPQPQGNSELLGYLWFANRVGEGDSACVFVAHQAQLVVNGLTPPLPAMSLDPGTLLSLRGDFWHYAVRWTPEVSEPPPHLLQKPCPVCGCPLEAAPAVQCLCGRWTHLQNPEAPDDSEALNCFLHAEKCQCQRRSSLSPLTEGEVPAS